MVEWKDTDYGKIPLKWKYVKGTEFCNKVTDGTHDSPKQVQSGRFLITSKHIKGRDIDFENAYKISEEDYRKIIARSHVDQWDVIISMIGEYCGFTYIERNRLPDYAVKNVGMFKTGSEDKAKWLHYYFNSKIGKAVLEAQKTGTSQPYITLGSLRQIEILIPDNESEIKSIAEVLSSLDDKIDLLNRQNKTLEELAEILFRQWFVEEAEDSWESQTIGNLFDVGIGRTPPRLEKNWFSNDIKDVKWISIKDMGNCGVYINRTAEYLTNQAITRFSIPVIPINTLILSFKMTIGRLAITTESMLSNEAIAHFKIKKESSFYPEFLYLFFKTFRWEQLGSTSSIVEAINSQMIKNIELSVPPTERLNEFYDVIKDFFHKLKVNQLQIQQLENLRDTLLPKLMSGVIRVMN
jgi:type I restriction enzyme S subunit